MMADFLEDPVSAGAMSLGLRLLATPGKFGQALGISGLGAMNDMNRARVLQTAEKDRALQAQIMQMQIEQMVEKQKRDAEARAQQGTDTTLLRTMMENGSQGPAMPPDPRLYLSRGGSLEGVQNLMALNNALAPKPRKLQAYKPGDQVRDEVTGEVAFEVPPLPEKPAGLPGSVQEYQFAVSQGYKGTFEQWDTARKKAGAANVNVGDRPPAGYRWNAAGGLDAIPGGPADKLPEKQQSQVIGAQNLRAGIAEYRRALAGFGGMDAIKPDARAAMGTKYNNMMLQAKEAYNLGVLNGPDLEILTSVITDPRSFTGALTSKSALDKQAAELDRIMQGIADVSSQGRPRGSASPAAAASAPNVDSLVDKYRSR